MSLCELSASELRDRLTSGAVSAREVSSSYCERIAAIDPHVRAFLRHDPEAVLAEASEIDARRAKGEPMGPLAGIPIALKDNLCTRGLPTTCASKILENFVPPYDAEVIRRLRAAGAVLLGKVNMDEFAMGSSTENSGFHHTRNPWDLDRVPGGSSGGSAAAVAARLAPWALGSDTGGSIRQPAGLCGVTGMKPSYGRVSRFGLVAFASSLDQIGPIARSALDAALLLEGIAGYDPKDSTSVDRPVPRYSELLDSPIRGLRIGIVAEYFGEGLDEEVAAAVRAAIDVLKEQGAEIREIRLPNARHAIATYYLVATAEASSNLARYDGVHFGHRASRFGDLVDMVSQTRGEGFGAEVKRRIMLGTFALSAGYRDAFYTNALRVRRLIKNDFDRAFEQVDVIAGPVSPTPAFRIGEKSADPLAMYLSDIYTVSTNLAGIAGLSIPCGLTRSGLPIGLQLQGPALGEEVLLRAAHQFQLASDWHCRRPPIGA